MVSKAIVTVVSRKTFFDSNLAFNFISNYIEEYIIIGETNTVVLSK